ncbi:ABC transporter ATP-binding protein [Loigolactobacillus zhaoyuanensis]|uniref:ABC transporter ATP-binding protein n=1 Tax=Loigolactobacillus zhaoyuanensis TaxID=2486017 RepID=UPI000F7412E9|nr:ABC transporter ATP-binding protein [Loigolactobacillus zhaoyuanensis]
MTELTAKGLSFGYAKTPLFSDIDFQLHSGQIHCILGPNGVGKSTLLNCLAGVYRPTSGAIMLDDQPLAKVTPAARARKIAYVPQMSSERTPVSFSLRDYVLLGRAPYLGLLAAPSQRDIAQADKLLQRFGLAARAENSYSAVSGGQQQLASIVRALLQEPALIIFDEPTSALDVANQVRVLQLIRQLAHDGYGIVLTTHDPNQALLLNDQVSTLAQDGRWHSGAAANILTSENLSQVYQLPLQVIELPDSHQKTCIVDQAAFRSLQGD